MDVVDAVLIVLMALAVLHGYRVGGVSQLLSVLGFLGGLAAGVAILLAVEPHVGGTTAKTIVAIACLLLPSTVLGNLARLAGFAAWRAIRRGGLGLIDSVAGAVVAVASTLVVAWLFASILANTAATSLNAALSRSVILRGVVQAMPPVPDAFAAVQRYLANNHFPEVLANMLPEHIGTATTATSEQVRSATGSAGASVVKVVALGCGEEQEGSGFVGGNGLVLTNAHVVAGTSAITVLARNGVSSPAVPIYFDPNLDLAVLRTAPLGEPALSISADYVERGGPAVVLGYPGGGPFHADGAAILARFDAVGRNIYDASLTTRTVYELQAIVRPGNSGGPLVLPSGQVIGVVFSRSSSNPDIGYALSSPAVLQGLQRAESSATTRVSTEGCTG